MRSSRRLIRSLVVGAACALLLPWVGVAPASATPSCASGADFASGGFSASTTIDNESLPLIPGTQLVLDGEADGLPHRVVLTVTDLTKVINGVRTLVIWDQDFSDGELQEAELAFQAQDDDGNVWNLGEYPEEFEDGEFIGAPSTWIAGVEEAEAGIHMLAEPLQGTGWYVQGLAPAIEFLDCGKVFKTGQKLCVPFACYSDVLVIDETSPLDQGGGHQRKYYAPGVGNVGIAAVGDPTGEALALARIVRLSSSALANARKAALKLERRAYQISDVYRSTPPMERLPIG